MTAYNTYNTPFLSTSGILRLAAMRLAAALRLSPAELRERETVFSEMTEKYSRLMASICLSFANSKEDFEDLRQESLINIWKGISGFRKESGISTWIYRVTLNTCVSCRRRSHKKNEVSLETLCTELYDSSTADDIRRYRLMYRLIGQLKPLDKSVMLMWLDEKSYEEISDVTGLSRDAVAARLRRAKNAIVEMYNAKKDI